MVDAELVGLWDSGPYDYGAMESSSLALLGDGSGWSGWQNVAGAMSVGRFRWSCPEVGMVELRYSSVVSGSWEPGNPGFARVEGRRADNTVLRTTYTIGRDTTVMSSGGFTALWLAEPVEFACQYGLRTREVGVADDPSVGRP